MSSARRTREPYSYQSLTLIQSSPTRRRIPRRLVKEPEANLEAVETLLSRLDVFAISREAALEAGMIMAHLERKGIPVEIRDIFIGARAKTNGVHPIHEKHETLREDTRTSYLQGEFIIP